MRKEQGGGDGKWRWKGKEERVGGKKRRKGEKRMKIRVKEKRE